MVAMVVLLVVGAHLLLVEMVVGVEVRGAIAIKAISGGRHGAAAATT